MNPIRRSRILMLFVAMFLVSECQTFAQKTYFPDLIFFPKNKDLNEIVVELTAIHLEAMKEPSLWKLSQQDPTTTVYRFLWLASREKPISIRLTRSAKSFSLHVSRHNGSPGTIVGEQVLDKYQKLSLSHGNRLIALIDKSPFWTSPVEVKESQGIADGDLIVIEGVKEGRYHVIDRAGSTAGESYKMFCRSLLELADQPALLKAWDRFREKERNRPDYRPEPPQTEDLGEFIPDPIEPKAEISQILQILC